MPPSLVEQVSAVLCRLADAPPAAAAARAAVSEIESASRRIPLTLGVGGELPKRTALFNDLCGDKLLDPFDRAPGCAAIRIRRGTARRFRVVRVDGGTATHDMPLETPEEVDLVRRAAIARAELDTRRAALAVFEADLEPKPKWWQFWKWFGRSKRTRERREQQRLAASSVGEAHAAFEAAEREASTVLAKTAPARDSYLALLRGLASGGAAGIGIAEIEIEVIDGILPEGVEVFELTGASRSGAEVDAVFVIEAGGVYAPGQPGSRPRIGEVADVMTALPVTLAASRSLGIGRRFRNKIAASISSLDDQIGRKEGEFTKRIAALEEKRVVDPAQFTEIQLARVHPQIIASINAVVEHASVHLQSELAQIKAQWVESLAKATSGGELAGAVAKIDEAWLATMQRIAEEVRLLAMGGVGGSARDLYAPLVAPLVEKGLPAEHAKPPRAAPQLAHVEILRSLTHPTVAKLDDTGFFAGLFRSFETRKSEVRAKAADRLQALIEVAAAELMDAEPKFHAAVRDALVAQLAAAIDTQTKCLEAALAAEREAIAREREALAPLVQVRDQVRADLGRLAAQIARLETEQPALAIACTAAETASLSH